MIRYVQTNGTDVCLFVNYYNLGVPEKYPSKPSEDYKFIWWEAITVTPTITSYLQAHVCKGRYQRFDRGYCTYTNVYWMKPGSIHLSQFVAVI